MFCHVTCNLPRLASSHVPREAAQSLCRHRSTPSAFGRFPADTAVNSSQHRVQHLKALKNQATTSQQQSGLLVLRVWTHPIIMLLCYSTLVCSGHFQVQLPAVMTERACLRHGLTIEFKPAGKRLQNVDQAQNLRNNQPQ